MLKQLNQTEMNDPLIRQCCTKMRTAVQINAIHIHENEYDLENTKIKLYYLVSVGEIEFCPWCGSGVLQ